MEMTTAIYTWLAISTLLAISPLAWFIYAILYATGIWLLAR